MGAHIIYNSQSTHEGEHVRAHLLCLPQILNSVKVSKEPRLPRNLTLPGPPMERLPRNLHPRSTSPATNSAPQAPAVKYLDPPGGRKKCRFPLWPKVLPPEWTLAVIQKKCLQKNKTPHSKYGEGWCMFPPRQAQGYSVRFPK